jgi:hypothetical protein
MEDYIDEESGDGIVPPLWQPNGHTMRRNCGAHRGVDYTDDEAHEDESGNA